MAGGCSVRQWAWLPEASNLVACSNGIVNLITGDQLRHTPYFLTMNAVDYAYDQEAKCARFDQFLNEIFPGSASQRPEDFEAWSDEC